MFHVVQRYMYESPCCNKSVIAKVFNMHHAIHVVTGVDLGHLTYRNVFGSSSIM